MDGTERHEVRAAAFRPLIPTPAFHCPVGRTSLRATDREPTEQPRLLEQVRRAARARPYSPRTEQAYAGWVRRYVLYHGKRHPAELNDRHVGAFLTHLAVERRVSAATQNQAASALLFLHEGVHEADLQRNAGWVQLPGALDEKYHCAGRDLAWQWLFPAKRMHTDPATGKIRRHHLHESAVQRAVTAAVQRARLSKRASCHSFRLSFATHRVPRGAFTGDQ